MGSGVVAFDLRTRTVKWSTHLDLSTDSTTFRAYVYSPPTLADVDRDGKLEVVIGTSVVLFFPPSTRARLPARPPACMHARPPARNACTRVPYPVSDTAAHPTLCECALSRCCVSTASGWHCLPVVKPIAQLAALSVKAGVQAPPPSPCQRARGVLPQGFLYVLDHRGAAKPGWPVQMGEIQGQPAAADVNGDGEMEIIAADTKGNVAAFTHRGLEVWERHLASLVAQAPSPPFSPHLSLVLTQT